MSYVQTHASTQGYAVTTKRSKYIYMNYKKVLKTAYLHCCKSGTYQNWGSEDKEKKDIATRLVDCLFHALICQHNKGQIYLF